MRPWPTRLDGPRDYGVHTGEVTVDFGAAIARVHAIIDGLRDGLADWISGVDGLELIPGTATLRPIPAAAATASR